MSSPSRLIRELHEDGLTLSQICRTTGLARAEVVVALHGAGVSKKAINRPVTLTAWEEAVLLGTLLGDGHLRARNKGGTPHLTLSHGAAQREFLEWKKTQLGDLFLAAEPSEHTDAEGHASVHAASRVLPLLSEYQALFYRAGKKVVTDALLSRVGAHEFLDAILAVWFADDGYRSSGNGRSLGFCFGALDEDTYERLAAWFTSLGYAGKLHVHMGRMSYRYFLMRVAAAHRFRDAIEPYVPPSMQYKLDIGPRRNVRRSRGTPLSVGA